MDSRTFRTILCPTPLHLLFGLAVSRGRSHITPLFNSFGLKKKELSGPAGPSISQTPQYYSPNWQSSGYRPERPPGTRICGSNSQGTRGTTGALYDGYSSARRRPANADDTGSGRVVGAIVKIEGDPGEANDLALTRSSMSLHSFETWLFEMPDSPIACTNSSTRRVETPPIQASWITVTNAFSLVAARRALTPDLHHHRRR
jgi:hypothetical protein